MSKETNENGHGHPRPALVNFKKWAARKRHESQASYEELAEASGNAEPVVHAWFNPRDEKRHMRVADAIEMSKDATTAVRNWLHALVDRITDNLKGVNNER